MKCLTIACLALALSLGEAIRNGISSRVIGGDEVEPHAYPYQAGMFLKVWGQDEKVFCGGSILTEVFILTAAHCTDQAYEGDVILGAHHINEEEDTQQRFFTKVFIVHKGWSWNTLENDIAIVRLPRPAQFNDAVQPIRLPKLSDQDKTFAFKLATITGWGKVSDDAPAISSVLRQMQSKVTMPPICKAFFFGRTGPDQMCVDGIKGKSTCGGDSGGPMTLPDEDGKPVQHGIVSYGIGFGCEKRWPQVFTKVSRYLKWIYEHTGLPIKP